MGLDTVELVMAFEEEFDIEIPDKAAEEIITVRDVRDFVAGEYLRLGRAVDRDDIYRRVRELTILHANVSPDEVTLDTSFVEDLRMD